MSLLNVAEKGASFFRLAPFSAGSLTKNLSIGGSVVRHAGVIDIHYQVKGAVDAVLWPASVEKPVRCHELWRQSCFELFFAAQEDVGYWEVNLSNNGCWNIYRFSDYRLAMREEEIMLPPSCLVSRTEKLLTLSCRLELAEIIDNKLDLQLGVAGVIQALDGKYSYWALEHHGLQPDFHNRSGFSLPLSGQKKTSKMSKSKLKEVFR